MKSEVRAAFRFQITTRGNLSIFQNQHFLATLFDVAEEMRGDDQMNAAGVANLADQLDHAGTGRRVQSIGRLIEEQQLRAMRNCLRQLGHLLHSQRVRPEFTIASFTQTDVIKRLVSALDGFRGREAAQFGHHAHESYSTHIGDERIVLGHIGR